ncbi:hypothetical protein [Flindersiella endophytica]
MVADQFLPPGAARATIHDLCLLELGSAAPGSSRQLQADTTATGPARTGCWVGSRGGTYPRD